MQLIAMIILTPACCVAANSYLEASAAKQHKKAVRLKSAASACFVGVGIIAVTGCWYSRFGYLVLAGLSCGFIGDVLLGMRFVYRKKFNLFFCLGTAFFAAGHVLYIIALLSFTVKTLSVAIPYTVIGVSLSVLYAKKQRIKAGKYTLVGAAYITLVVFMAGCAAGCAVYALSPGTILFAIGGLFFAVSDNLLAANCLGKTHTVDRDRALHILYYSAQIFIGYSMIMLFVL